MITYYIRQILLLWLVLFLPALAYGAPPSGDYELNFGGGLSVWDVSGTYVEDDFGASLTFDVAQDDKGKITGGGSATVSDPGITINLDFSLKGAIKAVAGVTRTDFKWKFTGTADDGLRIYPVKGNMRLKLEIDNFANQMIGTANGKICAKGLGCDGINETALFDIPLPEDGTWRLNLTISPTANGKRLMGTGTATLANGRVESFTLTGKHISSTDRSQLKLKGNAGLFTLHTNVVGTNLVIQMMNAKLLGQKVRTP